MAQVLIPVTDFESGGPYATANLVDFQQWYSLWVIDEQEDGQGRWCYVLDDYDGNNNNKPDWLDALQGTSGSITGSQQHICTDVP